MQLARNSRRIASATAVLFIWSGIAAAQTSACDLDRNGSTNVLDVTQAVNMVLGTTACSANVEAPLTCSIVTVQRVVNAALGQTCVTYNQGSHSVTLNWVPSVSTGVVGYNVYRRVSGSNVFAKVSASVLSATSFDDSSVLSGVSYDYAVTSVGTSGNESDFSVAARADIPSI